MTLAEARINNSNIAKPLIVMACNREPVVIAWRRLRDARISRTNATELRNAGITPCVNVEHRHSGIARMRTRVRNPARWSGETLDWSPVGPVTLNPEHGAVVTLAAARRCQ